MIVAQGLCSPHSFVRTRSLFRAMAQCWSFSQAQKKLTQSAQKAVWATHIIKTIEQAQPPKSAAQPSLREKILNLQAPSQDYAFDPECKNQVLSLFEGGIVLNPNVFAQDRVTLARQPTSINIGQTANQGKFIFCPTSLVTKHIFEYLGSNQTNNFFISGGYGISKTVSIILYLHLNNFITKYFCEVSRHNPSGTQGQNQEDNVSKAEQMQELQRKGLLRQIAYKYFYWSIDQINEDQNEQLIKNVVFQQAVQLSEEQKQLNKFALYPRSFYPPNVQVRSIVDQINKLASLIRRSNYKKEQINRMEQGKIKKMADVAFEQNYLRVSWLRIYLKQFISIGRQFGVNSSATIQRQLLKTPNKGRDFQTLSLEDRKLLTYYRVPYEKSISSPEGSNEFKQLIWFEIERRLSSCKTSQELITSIKKRFYEEVTNMRISGFAKFLTVRQKFEKENLSKLISEKKEDGFMQWIKDTLFELDKAGLETEIALFKRIFDKSKYQEKIIIGILHKIAELQRIKENKRHQLFSFESKDIQVDEKLRGYNLSEKLSQLYRNTSEFQEKLPYELLEDGSIRLPWTVQQFLIISSEALYPETAEEYRNMLVQNNIQNLIENGGAKGIQLQLQLRKCLGKGQGTMATIITYTQQNPDTKNRLQSKAEIIQVKHVTKFLHFNKKSNESFVDYNLRQLLDVSRRHPNQFCVAIPHYKNQKGVQAFSGTSKVVDFIICEFNEKNVFCLTTYDATVSTSFPKKEIKYPKFYREHIFKDMEENKIDASKFKFRHVIICPREACKPMEVIKVGEYSYTVQYADALHTALITECKDQKAMHKLKEVQRLTRLQLNDRLSSR